MNHHHLFARTTTQTRTKRFTAVTLAVGALVLGLAATSSAFVQPGTPAKDVTVGLDNDNAANPFIQPPGVVAKQDMNNTDVLFGRANADLLIGRLGADTLLGGTGSDILVGGPEKSTTPSGDVLVGDLGNDIGVWAPGDGNDAFIGNENRDTMILAPLVEKTDGSVLLTRHAGRKVPRVDIDDQPTFSCTLVKVPEAQRLGFQFLVRFEVDHTLVATVRLKDVERVLCPSPRHGRARAAALTVRHPAFHTVRLRLHQVKGATGGILAPVG